MWRRGCRLYCVIFLTYGSPLVGLALKPTIDLRHHTTGLGLACPPAMGPTVTSLLQQRSQRTAAAGLLCPGRLLTYPPCPLPCRL